MDEWDEVEGLRVVKEEDDTEWAYQQKEHPPGKVRTLKDMTPEEIAALERLYGAKVKR